MCQYDDGYYGYGAHGKEDLYPIKTKARPTEKTTFEKH